MIGLLIATVALVADQVTKLLALMLLFARAEIVEVLPFFNFVAVWNRGVSFGLFASDSAYGPLLLSALAVVVTIGLIIWLTRAENRLLAAGLGFIIGGAVGNVIDRLRFGAVIDFLDFHMLGYHWPAFNLADAAITLGVALLLWDSFKDSRNKTDEMGAE